MQYEHELWPIGDLSGQRLTRIKFGWKIFCCIEFLNNTQKLQVLTTNMTKNCDGTYTFLIKITFAAVFATFDWVMFGENILLQRFCYETLPTTKIVL